MSLTRKLEGGEKGLPSFPDCDVAQLRCERLYVRNGSGCESPSVYSGKLADSMKALQTCASAIPNRQLFPSPPIPNSRSFTVARRGRHRHRLQFIPKPNDRLIVREMVLLSGTNVGKY